MGKIIDFLSRDIRNTVFEAMIGFLVGWAVCLVGIHNGNSEEIWLGLVILAIEVYLFPTIVARIRRKRNKTPICLLNLFLGWTVLGWIGALIWAFMVDEIMGRDLDETMPQHIKTSSSSAVGRSVKPRTSQPSLWLVGASALVSAVFIIATLREHPPTGVTGNPGPAQGMVPVSNPLPTAPAAQPVLQSFSWTDRDTTYHGAMSSNVGVVVLEVKSGTYFIRNPYGPYGIPGPEDVIKAEGKFIIVRVGIYNHQNSAITMDSGLFKILDSEGNEYSTSEKSMEVGRADSLFLAQINPGMTRTGEIIFDVPENLNLDNLLLRFRGGMTGDSADLPLKVNSTVKQVPAPPESGESSQELPQAPLPPPEPLAPGNESQTGAAGSLLEAAMRGNAVAQYKLGSLYYLGKGVPQDYAKAYFWFATAGSGKVEGVKQDELQQDVRDAASHLTAAELSQGQERVRKWLEEHPTKTE